MKINMQIGYYVSLAILCAVAGYGVVKVAGKLFHEPKVSLQVQQAKAYSETVVGSRTEKKGTAAVLFKSLQLPMGNSATAVKRANEGGGSVKIQGLVLTGTEQKALLSLEKKKAVWVRVGESIGDSALVLNKVQGDGVWLKERTKEEAYFVEKEPALRKESMMGKTSAPPRSLPPLPSSFR